MGIDRENWKSRMGFLLAAVGSAVGLGNIWRFNYLAYKNGGGAFLIPYIVALLTAGLPILILEFGLGHKMRGAPPTALIKVKNHEGANFQPLGWWGVTLAMFGINLYYSVVISWCIRYFFFSFNLGWTKAGLSAEQFFLKKHLMQTDSMWDFTTPVFWILIGLAVVWFINWLVVYRGIQAGIEKVNKIFMPLLLVLITVLVVRGVTLPGAGEGIKHYLKPDFSKLLKPSVWIAAYGQIFFTLSIGFGIMIAYSSYLPKKTNIVGNAKLTALLNCAFSIFAGFAVFGTLGYLAHTKGVPVDSVVSKGAGLAFVVFPEAIAKIKFLPQVIGAVFFLSLIVAGLSSSLSLVEAFSSSVVDKFGWARKKIVSVVCILGFLGGIIFTLGNGSHWLEVVDMFMTSYGLVFVGLLQCLVIGWIYGAKNLRHHINFASSRRMRGWFDICIKYVTPVVLLVILGVKINNEIQALVIKESRTLTVTERNKKQHKFALENIKKIELLGVKKYSVALGKVTKISALTKAGAQFTALLNQQNEAIYRFSHFKRAVFSYKRSPAIAVDFSKVKSVMVYVGKENKKYLFPLAKTAAWEYRIKQINAFNGAKAIAFLAGFLWLLMTVIASVILAKKVWRNKEVLKLGHHFEEGEDYHLH